MPKQQEKSLLPEESIAQWIESEASRTEETAKTYRASIRALERFVKKEGLDIDALAKTDIELFRDDLLKNHSPSTANVYLNGVRSWYRWANNDAFEDVAFRVKGASTSKGFKKDFLSAGQARKLLESIDTQDEKGMRDFCIINLMLRTGLRDVEVARADIGDISTIGDSVTLAVHGKGHSGKDAFVVLTPKAKEPIQDYLRKFRANSTTTSPLFASVANRNHGERMTKQSVSRMIKQRLVAAGFNSPRLTAHSLRHTAITLSLLAGAKVEEAQQMARHADISTTMIYAHHIERLKNPAESKIDDIL